MTRSSDLKSLLPQQLSGWQQDGRDYLYGPKTLYDYIDGGAELYLSYGFKKVLNRIYVAPDQPDILIDIFDMINSANAYGVYSHSREKENRSIGQGGQYVPGLLLFWKGRYFISILATPETPKAKKAIFELANHIENHIENSGSLPPVLRLLPQTDLLNPSIRYFRHSIWLNSYYYISADNILNLNDRTEAVLAKYEFDQKERPLLLIVQYPDKETLIKAEKRFRQHYYQSQQSDIIRISEKSWSGIGAYKGVLAVVFKANQKSQAEELLQRALQRIKSEK